MVNTSGTRLCTGIWELSPHAGSVSIFNWHLGKIPITQKHRVLWNQILNTITFNNSTELHNKLGSRTTSPSTSCPHRLHQHVLYNQYSDGLWYKHLHLTTQHFTKASQLTFELAGCTQQQLPTGATIVDVRIEGETLYVAQDPDLALDDSTYNETSTQRIQQSPMANAHLFANFQGFVAANIKTFLRTDEDANRFVT